MLSPYIDRHIKLTKFARRHHFDSSDEESNNKGQSSSEDCFTSEDELVEKIMKGEPTGSSDSYSEDEDKENSRGNKVIEVIEIPDSPECLNVDDDSE